MELKLRDLLFFGALLAIFPLGVYLFVASTKASPVPTDGPVPPLGATLGTPPPAHVAETAHQIAFHNQSETWTWENGCADELARFVTGNGFPVTTLTITLVDEDADLPLGVVYPSVEDPDALALTTCTETGGGLACQVAIGAGAPGAALDTAMATALGYGVREHFRVKTRETWNENQSWRWVDFVPLIEQDGEVWRSTCLEVRK